MKLIVIKEGEDKVTYFGPYMTMREAALFIRRNAHPDYKYEISEIYKTVELTHRQPSTIIEDKEGTSETTKPT